MRIDISFGTWVASLGAGAAVLAALGVGALLLARRDGSRLANASLGGLLVVAGLAVFYTLLLVVQPPGENLGVVLAPLLFSLSLGPLLYAYVRARLGLGRPAWGHAVLPVVQAVVVLTVGLGPMAWKAWFAGNVYFPWWGTAQIVLSALSLGGYLALSVRALRASRAAFAWAVRRDRWLGTLLAGCAVAAVGLVAVDLGVPLVTGRAGAGLWSVWLYAAVLALMVAVGLVQAGVLSTPGRAAPAPVADPPSAELAREQAATLAALDALVEAEHPHLDPDLTLGSLARQVGVTDKVLSGALNAARGGYAELVNGLRVDEARRRLRDPAHAPLSVLAVGLDAGFASKSTFNRVFKERTGQTPSAYRTSEAPRAPEPVAG